MAADVADLEEPLLRELPLYRDLIPQDLLVLRVDRREPSEALAQEGVRAERVPGRLQDAQRVRVVQRGLERQAPILGGDERRDLREAVLLNAADDVRHHVNAGAAAEHRPLVETVREPDARHEVRGVGVPEGRVAVGRELQAAARAPLRGRDDVGPRGVSGFRRGRDRQHRGRVEPAHVAVVRLRRRRFVVVAEPEVQRETGRDFPVVLHVEAVIPRVVRPRAVQVDVAAGRDPQQEGRDILEVLRRGIVLLPRERPAACVWVYSPACRFGFALNSWYRRMSYPARSE